MTNNDKKGINPAATGVIGAVIGAAATAAAIALSDEKNRKKVEQILKDLEKRGDKIFKEVSKRAMELKDLSDKALPQPKSKGTKKSASKKR